MKTLEPERGREVQGEKSLTATNQNAEPKEVRDFCNSVTSILEELQKQSEDFRAGQICFCLAQWKQITTDEGILKMVEGVDIDFTELLVQEKPAHNHTFSTEQIHAIDLEVWELLKRGVIRKAHDSNKEYISPIFVLPKKDNRWRMILNLKDLNKKVEYFHFKMETLKNGLALVKPNCFFCSLVLKDAYFSVHVNKSSQEYLKFLWGGQLYMFTAFPNGLACCSRLFTKTVETSDGPSSYARLCVSNLY